MFSHAFFGAGYFGPSYFGPAGAAAEQIFGRRRERRLPFRPNLQPDWAGIRINDEQDLADITAIFARFLEEEWRD